MITFDDKKIKMVLEKVLEEREDNYIRLSFDLYVASIFFPKDEEKKHDELKVRVEEIQKQLDEERQKPKKLRDREKIIQLEEQLDGKINPITKQKVIGLRDSLGELANKLNQIRIQVKQNQFKIGFEEKLITALEDCINKPKQIYEHNNK